MAIYWLTRAHTHTLQLDMVLCVGLAFPQKHFHGFMDSHWLRCRTPILVFDNDFTSKDIFCAVCELHLVRLIQITWWMARKSNQKGLFRCDLHFRRIKMLSDLAVVSRSFAFFFLCNAATFNYISFNLSGTRANDAIAFSCPHTHTRVVHITWNNLFGMRSRSEVKCQFMWIWYLIEWYLVFGNQLRPPYTATRSTMTQYKKKSFVGIQLFVRISETWMFTCDCQLAVVVEYTRPRSRTIPHAIKLIGVWYSCVVEFWMTHNQYIYGNLIVSLGGHVHATASAYKLLAHL